MVGEILLNAGLDYLFFSFLESLVFYLFFYYIGNLKKMKWYEIGVMGIGNAFISQMLPVVVYQMFIIIWMTLILKIINGDKHINYCLKYSLLSILFFLVTEVFIDMIVDLSGLIDPFKIESKFGVFLFLIPIRIFQFLILRYNKNIKNFIKKRIAKFMKIFTGTGTTRK